MGEGWGEGKKTAQFIHPHPDLPPSRGKETESWEIEKHEKPREIAFKRFGIPGH